jgi:hypothetical protein
MKFRIISFGLVFLFSLSFSKTSYLNINLNDGSTITIPIDEITKITFDSLYTDIQKVRKLQKVIKAFTLFQNYPNPFNPNTTINYSIPVPGAVEIKIYNIAGQFIREVKKEHDSAGAFSIQWNGKNEHNESVASGIYIYQARFENSLISKKMIIVK